LAAALTGNPAILVLDEPTVGLDPAQIIEIRSLILELGKTRTVLLSSHILSEVEAVCGRVIVLHQGRIRADLRTGGMEGSGAEDGGLAGTGGVSLEKIFIDLVKGRED
jgi:ABC-2 type transport system ATP-binding protein